MTDRLRGMSFRTAALVVVAVSALVSTAAGTASAATSRHAPRVSSVSPRTGRTLHGTRVTVTGTGFTRGTAVRFGTAKGTGVHVSSSRRLTVLAPSHRPGVVDVTVTTKSGRSTARRADRYTFVAPPAVSRITPGAVRTVGESVTVTGSGFTRTSTVRFGSARGTHVAVRSSRTLTVLAPAHAAGSAAVVVTSAYGSSRARAVRYYRDTTAPGSVTAMYAADATPSSVTIGWTRPTAADVAGFVIRRADGTGAPATVADGTSVARVAASATSVTDSGLAPSHTYSYAVFAYDSSGNTAAGAAVTATTTPTTAGSLSGTVTAGSGAPVSGVTVRVLPVARRAGRVTTLLAKPYATVTTQTDGTWSVPAGLVPYRPYAVCFDASTSANSNYVTECRGATKQHAVGNVGQYLYSFGEPIVLAPGESRTGVDEQLLAGGTLTGTVTDSGGAPIAGVRVSTEITDDPTTDLPGPHSVLTAADGTYSLDGIGERAVNVCFLTSDATGAGSATGYAARCSGSTDPIDSDDFDPSYLHVGAGATVRVDETLPEGGAITGTVTDSAGDPLPGVAVSAVEGSPNTTSTANDGSYTLRGLDPTAGGYTVCFDGRAVTAGTLATGYPQASVGRNPTCDYPDDNAPAGIDVTRGATARADEVLSPGAAVRGTITDAHGAPLAGVGIATAIGTSGADAVTDASGHYSITGLDADPTPLCFFTADVTGSSPTGYASRCNGSSTVPEEPPLVRLTAGAVRTVDASLADGAAVAGHVTDAHGSPVAGVAAVASATFEAGNGRELTSSMGGYDVYTAADGSYEITGLPVRAEALCFGAGPLTSGTSASGYLSRCLGGSAWDGQSDPPSSTRRSTTAAGRVIGGADGVLPVGGGFTGTVLDTHGAPLTNVEVSLESTDGTSDSDVSTDTDGSFTVTGLAAGKYDVCYYPGLGRSYGGTVAGGQSSLCPSAAVVITAGAVRSGGTVTLPDA